jgi:hypothetical protein
MNTQWVVAIVLACATLLGSWSTARGVRPRKPLRIALQVVAALLVYLLLYPPTTQERFEAGTLVVLTPGITTEQSVASASASAVVALPDTDAPVGVERVPDLGTALRRYPDATRLKIVGDGLPARDLDAARGMRIEFDAAPARDGLVELSSPSLVRAGSIWKASGRVHGNAGGRVELRDPAGAVVATAPLEADGAFALSAQARRAGNALFALRVLDGAGAPIENLALPIVAREGDAMRVLLLAGAPDPDIKYLRRWAVDAGVEMTSRIAVSDGIALRDGTAMLTPETLAQTDLVIVDERAWNALDANAKTMLANALREGLGIVLRVAGPVPDDVAAQWQTFGFKIEAADIAQDVALEKMPGTPELPPAVSRRAVAVSGGGEATPLLRAADGSPVALWRSEGSGRVAVWWLGDSYRLSLGGEPGRFGTLWSDAFATIARARAGTAPTTPPDSSVNERSVLCDLAPDAFVEQPDGMHVALAIEKQPAGSACAAYWPAAAGWHTLVSANARWPFHVRSADEGKSLAAARNAAATQRLATNAGSGSDVSARPVPMPRWPLFLAALLALAVLWWLERGTAQRADA